jgi:asparagine synthase (glutamine-hydrolysing)
VAERVAAACGLPHHLLRLNDDFFNNFAAHADRNIFVTDGTFTIIGTHEIFLHRQARQLSPVRLTGNYGSEVLRGMATFKARGLKSEIFQPEQFQAVQKMSDKLVAEKTNRDTFSIFKEIPWNLYGSMTAGRSLVTFRTPYLDNEITALAYQMPAVLYGSSLPSLHLIKASSPALDKIPTDRGYISDRSGPDIWCRRAFAEVTFKFDYHYDAGLPPKLAAFNPLLRLFASTTGIAGLHKFLQYSTWMRNQLAPYVREHLAAASRSQAGRFWSAACLKDMAEKHVSGRENYSAEINAVLTLEATERVLIRDLPRDLEPD